MYIYRARFYSLLLLFYVTCAINSPPSISSIAFFFVRYRCKFEQGSRSTVRPLPGFELASCPVPILKPDPQTSPLSRLRRYISPSVLTNLAPYRFAKVNRIFSIRKYTFRLSIAVNSKTMTKLDNCDSYMNFSHQLIIIYNNNN